MEIRAAKFFLLSILFGVIIYLPICESSNNNQESIEKEFGGPDAVENQIKSDAAITDSFLNKQLSPSYYDFKNKLVEKYGLSFQIDYSYQYRYASEVLSGAEDDSAAGMIRFFGAWELIGDSNGNSGALVWKGEHRHRTTNDPPSSLSFNSGYAGIIDPPFNNNGLRLTNFYWRQRIQEPRITITAGLLDVTDYVDAFALGSPWTHFSNLVFSTGSASIDLPNEATIGIAAGAMLSNNFYLIGGITNANSDPTDPLDGFDSLNDNEFFKSVEIGWTSSADRIILDNFHLTYWQIDEREKTNTPDGWGVNWSASYFISDSWMPFLRGGYTKDSGSLLENSLSVGVGYQPIEQRNKNLLGIAVNWGEPNDSTFGSGLDDQYTFELFYRLQLTKEIAITPDIQYIVDPALNPDDSNSWYFGVRSRIVF